MKHIWYVTRSDTILAVIKRQFPQYTKDELLSFILCGNVTVGDVIVKKHTDTVRKNQCITLTIQKQSYASRGAYKLQSVLDAWNVVVKDGIWLDVGSATGGFTDELLQRSATVVHAVDVGYNVLSYKLRSHKSVIVHERTNIMHISSLEPQPQYAVVDVSFRSLRGLLPHVFTLCSKKYVLALCKPQFEFKLYRKEHTHTASERDDEPAFSGVVQNSALQKKIIVATICALADEGAFVSRIHAAKIRGRKGNQEFFF